MAASVDAALVAGCGSAMTTQQIAVTQPRPATLTADLFKPPGDGPFPALVLLHGCSGPQPNGVAWAQWLQARGYVALALDSFSGRGLRRVCGDSSVLTGGARAPDVYAAAKHLAGLSFVDKSRLGAIGWSHGGWTVLQASRLEGVHKDVSLKAMVAFYPGCDIAIYRASAPLLILAGADDNWTPPLNCQALTDRSRSAGHDVTIVVYPGAQHGFDSPNIRQRTYIADARRGAGATIEYNPAAHQDAERQLERFLAAHLHP
jgi:dienelactone hydrolase